MKMIFTTLLLVTSSCFAMDKSLVHEILTREGAVCDILPPDISRKLAQTLLNNHPMVPFLLKRLHFPSTTLEGHTDRVISAQFNQAGDKIVTASGDKTAKIWDTKTGDCLATLKGHTTYVRSAQFNQAGDKIVTASWDNTAKIWDAKTGDCLATLEGHTSYVISAQFNQAGDKIVTASNDNTAKIWNYGAYLECQQFLSWGATFKQAAIINAIYEVMVARALIRLHGANAFRGGTVESSHDGIFSRLVESSRYYISAELPTLSSDEITFNFNKHPHLQTEYDNIPKELRIILDNYITKLNNEATK